MATDLAANEFNHVTVYDSEDSLSDSGSDSKYSCQSWATEYVRDSWEDWSPSSSSSSSSENERVVVARVAVNNETLSIEEDEVLIVGSESSSAEDFVLHSTPPLKVSASARDIWKCVTCGVINEWPLRYCSKCYKLRKGWLPDRPNKRKRKRKADTTRASRSVIDSQTSTVTTASAESLIQSSQDIAGAGSQESAGSSVQDTAGPILLSSQNIVHDDEPEKPGLFCGICGLNPCNGVFLHGRTSHQMCCFRCCKKLWAKRKDCPVCRQKIDNVIKVFRRKTR